VRSYLPFIIVGLTTGSVYGLAATGLVLTYKTSGVFNFGHGAVGMIATYIFYSLRVDAGVPTWLAFVIAVGVAGPVIGVLLDRVLFRRLYGAPAASYVVASLGLLITLQSLAFVIYGASARIVDPIFPTSTFRLFDVNVGYDQLLVVVISLTLAGALGLFFARTSVGVRMRAVVDNPKLTELSGHNSGAVTTLSWMLGSSLAALSGILLAPFLGLDAVLLTLLVIQAFAAAVVGRLSSLPVTYAAGIGVGIAAALSTKLVAHHQLLVGVPGSLAFVILFCVLVFSPKGRFREVVQSAGRATERVIPSATRLPRTLPALIVVAVAIPWFLNGSERLTATRALIYVLIFASLNLVVGLSRQVSLCHVVFVVFGATTLAHLSQAGVPFPLAFLLAGLAAVPLGAIVAVPSIRLSGLFLALATFGFGLLVQNLLFETDISFGSAVRLSTERPSLFGISLAGDNAFYFFCLAVVVVGVLAIEAVRITRLGRLLRQVADSQTAVESLGVNPTASRVLVFCVSAFLGGLGGALLGSLSGSIQPGSFDFTNSLIWVAVVVTAGTLSLGGAVLGAILFVVVPTVFTSNTVLEWQPVFFGVAAIVLAQTPNGIVGLIRAPDFRGLAAASRWRLERTPHANRVTA
jgi:branched-subunit amino acid ABC-type transport system permease component